MNFSIRPYESGDEDEAVALSLRAWTPVFASMRNVLGPHLETLLHGDDWRVHQEAAVRGQLADGEAATRVAELEGPRTHRSAEHT